MSWVRRLFAKNFVKITRQTGDGEIIEISFNDSDDTLARTRANAMITWLDARLRSHNDRVLKVAEEANRTRGPRSIA